MSPLPQRTPALFAALALALALTACGPGGSWRGSDPGALLVSAGHEAANGGLAPYTAQGGGFTLAGFSRPGPGRTLTVYIEGDGLAWSSRSTPSSDPTPRTPLALRLAARDPAPKLLYLARPCQYLASEQAAGMCQASLWTSARYGPAVLEAFDQALDQAKLRLGADRLSLVGYSGGGVLALLLAARRSDVLDVLTLGANLDIEAWAAHHGVSPLRESLNPADRGAALAGVWQTHLVGRGDVVSPPWLCEAFLDRIGRPERARCLPIEGADHRTGFETLWPELVADHRHFVGSR